MNIDEEGLPSPSTPRIRAITYPDHFSPVTDTTGSPEPLHIPAHPTTPAALTPFPGHNQQVMSPRGTTAAWTPPPVVHPFAASASGTTTPFAGATFTQATRIEVPVHVLEQFAQQNTIDNEILGDLRAAVVELHDRMQHRTNILGTTTTSLADGYNLVVENLGRLQQGLDAHSEVITRLVQDNRGIHDELEATRAQLEEVRTMAQTPRLGPEQWQAQVEAHILKLQNEFDMRMKQVDDDHHSTKSRVRNLEDRAVSRTEVPDAHMVQEQVDETFSAVQHLRSVVEAKHLELDHGLAEARESIQDLSNTQRKVEKSLDHLQALCEQFAMNSDGEEQADEQYLD